MSVSIVQNVVMICIVLAIAHILDICNAINVKILIVFDIFVGLIYPNIVQPTIPRRVFILYHSFCEGTYLH